MKSEKIIRAIGGIGDELIKAADITKKKKYNSAIWWKVGAAVAAVCLLIAFLPYLGNNEEGKVNSNPLVITVYARDDDGNLIPTAMEVGEKVKLHPATSPYAENFNGYAFDLTLLEAKYVRSTAVDENWQPKLYPGYGDLYTEDDFHWSLTEGDEIYFVTEDEDGNAVSAEKARKNGWDELAGPRPHGSEIIWRPNDDGLSRTIISVYGEDLKLITRYYLEITEDLGEYYAEVVKISK